MSIIRSLFIRLGFEVDKKEVNNTNKAINGFKTRFAAAATVVGFAFSRVVNFFNDIAKATVESEKLARQLGLSFEQLREFQRVGSIFGVSQEDSVKLLSTSKKIFNEFKQGSSKFTTLFRDLGINLNNKGNFTQGLQEILRGLSEIEMETTRIDVATKLFGDDLALVVSDLSKDWKRFGDSAKLAIETTNSDLLASASRKEYSKAINDLSAAWSRFGDSVEKYVIPGLVLFFDTLTGILDLLGAIANFKWGDVRGILDRGFDSVKIIGSEIFKDVKGLANSIVGSVYQGSEVQRVATEIVNSYNPEGYKNSPQSTMTTNIEVNVPPGTERDQAEFISSSIRDVIQEEFGRSWQDISSNMPVYE